MQNVTHFSDMIDHRSGKLTLTPFAERNMRSAGLDIATVYDVFRYGDVITENRIVRICRDYEIGIEITPDKKATVEGRYLVLSCWKTARTRGSNVNG
jgi:hypothetical protein